MTELICPICLESSTVLVVGKISTRCGVFDCPGTLVTMGELKKASFVNRRSKKRSWIVYGNA